MAAFARSLAYPPADVRVRNAVWGKRKTKQTKTQLAPLLTIGPAKEDIKVYVATEEKKYSSHSNYLRMRRKRRTCWSAVIFLERCRSAQLWTSTSPPFIVAFFSPSPSSPEHKTFFWTSEFKGKVHSTAVEQFQPFVFFLARINPASSPPTAWSPSKLSHPLRCSHWEGMWVHLFVYLIS